MAMQVKEIKEWLSALSDDDSVGVDDGGLCLCVVDDPEPYLEIGGMLEEQCEKVCECLTVFKERLECGEMTRETMCDGCEDRD